MEFSLYQTDQLILFIVYIEIIVDMCFVALLLLRILIGFMNITVWSMDLCTIQCLPMPRPLDERARWRLPMSDQFPGSKSLYGIDLAKISPAFLHGVSPERG